MRCPSCGTENAPDSRFCGGCGARLSAAIPRLAPTQKIADEASFPERPYPAAPDHGAQVSQLADTPQSLPLVPPVRSYAPSGPAVAAPRAPQPLRPIASAPPVAYAPPAAPIPAPIPAPPSTPAAGVPSGAKPSRPRTAPIIADPSRPRPMAARPWRRIVLVLLIDLGLAIAGGWMLREGLGGRSSAGSAAGAIHQPPRAR